MAKINLTCNEDFNRACKIYLRQQGMLMMRDQRYKKAIEERTRSMLFKAANRPLPIKIRVEEMEEDLPWPSPTKYKKIPLMFKAVECLQKNKQVSSKMGEDTEEMFSSVEDTVSSAAEDTAKPNIDHAEPSTSKGRRCMEKDEDISVASGVSAWSPPDGRRRLNQPNLYCFFPTASVTSVEGQSMPAHKNDN